VIHGIQAGAVSCDAVDARFVGGLDGASLVLEALRAEAEGATAVIVRPGPLGDPIVLAAGLSPAVPGMLLGACVALGRDGRHPALVARELTSLDQVCGGRSALCCAPPFDETLAEALALCRAMWREGHAVSDGPAFPVPGARHRPRPARPAGPVIALDLTGEGPSGALAELCDDVVALADFVLRPTVDPVVGRLEAV
jgi:alkanesulfonate monooxygenase SsuD/methylene tetrahydromethanopterin reductase-like flavin-dependent oxidoreductase (luciferase family)